MVPEREEGIHQVGQDGQEYRGGRYVGHDFGDGRHEQADREGNGGLWQRLEVQQLLAQPLAQTRHLPERGDSRRQIRAQLFIIPFMCNCACVRSISISTHTIIREKGLKYFLAK